MSARTWTSLIKAADKIGQTLRGYIDELGELSPSEIEIRLGMRMEQTTVGERQLALLAYLDKQPSDLRLQMSRNRGNLEFGTFWLQSSKGESNRLWELKCPASLLAYLDGSAPRAVGAVNFGREVNGALLLLAHRLGLEKEPQEVLRRGLMLMFERHHALVEAMIGYDGARKRHAEELAALAEKGVFPEETLRQLELARKEVAGSFEAIEVS